MKSLLNTPRLPRISLCLALALALGACGEDTPAPGEVPGGEEVRSAKQRVLSPATNPADVDQQVAGNTDFAFDLLQQIRGEPENIFFSPHSISVALAMLQAGARGQTEAQIAQVMRYLDDQDKLHPAFNWLDLELNNRGAGSKAADGEPFRLEVVNALWGQTGYTFLPEFLDRIALNYGAGLRLLDFAGDQEGSRQTINAWVEDQTEERIKDLLPKGVITSLTRLVLTNAIYFNAAWAKEFDKGNSKDRPFTLADGTAVDLPTMSGEVGNGFYSDQGIKAAALPYDGNELSMVVMIPDQVDREAFEAGLTGARIQQVIDGLQAGPVQVTMPSFEFEAPLGLKAVLSQMGMVDAFTPAADLSGINGGQDLLVQDVLHKAFVKVNEAGTEAAAATAVVVGLESAGEPQPKSLVVDQPFVFFIYDHATSAVLFVGRMLDPR